MGIPGARVTGSQGFERDLVNLLRLFRRKVGRVAQPEMPPRSLQVATDNAHLHVAGPLR